MFLWHFPSSRLARVLPGTLPGGARTFLPPDLSEERPPGPLTPPQSSELLKQGSNALPEGDEPGIDAADDDRNAALHGEAAPTTKQPLDQLSLRRQQRDAPAALHYPGRLYENTSIEIHQVAAVASFAPR